ncbi:MAG: hypothetical protein B6I20_09975 [Bacteroidetes bacterium 4572_117]|nr:MAG: hypothetical protein B6I20_09975 [Bacteroidetes bacterium 4572_117]
MSLLEKINTDLKVAMKAKHAEKLSALRAINLPEQMSDDELTAIIQSAINETGASSMKDMGKVMGIVNKKVAGKAEGKIIAQKVKSLLA